MKDQAKKCGKGNGKMALRNSTSMCFVDISNEKVRHYVTPTFELVIKNPLYLHISLTRGHYILAEDGWCYYVRPSDGERSYYLRWKPKANQPHFIPVG